MAKQTDLYVGTLVGLGTLAGVAYLAFRRGGHRPERILLGLAFFSLLAAALFRTRHGYDWYFLPLSQARYVFLPQLLAIWLLVGSRGREGAAGADLRRPRPLGARRQHPAGPGARLPGHGVVAL